jgi:CRISPR/Cas system CSM-associated protein Csm2 small subunit
MPLPLAGIGMGLMNILRAGRLAQGARAAYTASRGLAGRALGTPGAGLGSGTSGTGLQGLMARGAKRFPGASGSAEAGTGLLLGGEGVGDIMEGYQEGDIGQMAMGLGSLALGTPLASKGLRLAGSQRTLKSKFPQTAEAMRTTGKEFSARIPKGTTAVGLGGYGTGLVLGDEPPVSEQEPQVISQNPVDIVIKAIEYDKANPGEAKEKLGFDVNSPQYKKLAKEQLTKAYQDAEKMNIKPAQTFDEVVSTFTFNPKDTGGAVITNQAVMPNIKDPENGNLSPAEVNALANKQLKQSEGGAKLKEEITKNASDLEAEQFNRFYDKITNLTGGNDQTNNLILFKLATGLMKGKTGQSGIRGFIDVLGQAGSDTTDVAMALFQKEADRRKDLAVSYLKAKEKSGNGIQVEKDRRRVVVRDPNLPWGARTIDIARDKDTGLDAMIIADPTTGGTKAVPMKYTEYTEVKPAEARLDKRRKQLDSIETGYELATQVLQLPTGTFGAGGRIRLGVENVLGSIESIANAVGIRDIGMVDSPIDGKIINDYIGGDKINDDGTVKAPTEAERKETAELQAQYRKEIGLITNSIRPGDEDLDNIVKAKLIEVRMKYILANALKDEDRLTRADIDDAAQATQILGLTSSDKVVKNAYKQLAVNLQKNFDRVARSYIEAGGNEDFLMGYQSMPKVASILKQRQNTQMKQNIQQQQMSVLGTIK